MLKCDSISVLAATEVSRIAKPLLLIVCTVPCVHLDAVHAAGQHIDCAKAVESEGVLWFQEPLLQDQQECDPELHCVLCQDRKEKKAT